MRILIIEDDPLIGDGMKKGLRLLGYAVDWFTNSKDGDQAMDVVRYDAVVLDLGLPGEDGIALLTRWRRAGHTLPVIILTARDAVESRIAGLDAGADDYLIKPITLDELAARLRAATRRLAGKPEPVWRHGALEYHPASHEVYWKGERVDLSVREALLLELFLTHPNRVLTREFIRDKLYDWDADVESNALEVYVHHVRKKIHPKIVRTLRGSGYALGQVDTDS
jgi:two-component system response regulator QseB